jgi:Cytochrome P460
VITVVRYTAQLDAEGNPARDANGRFIKTTNILGYGVREKRTGWGAEYPEGKGNGDWEYRVFRADRTADPDTNYDNCFGCHKSQESQEYMFTFDSLKVALR